MTSCCVFQEIIADLNFTYKMGFTGRLQIKGVARRKGIKFQSYAPNTVKKHIAGNGRASKMEVAKVVVSKYPELKVYLTQDRAWKERFHQNMFDAVAIGMLAEQLEKRSEASP